MSRLFKSILLLLLPFSLHAQSPQPSAGIKDSDRIIFVGDSITGQGAKGGATAWMSLIGEGLKLARPSSAQTLIGLGGSGSTVNAWLNHEKKSRTQTHSLDVKELDVGKSLDAGAEVLIIMLGMNDVLAPSLSGDEASFNKWIASYEELVDALRARCQPKTIALATITPCTEDATSPKNQALAQMNQRLAKLAAEKHYLLLLTNEASYELQKLGRTWEPYFQFTTDLVHPNRTGHLAIAVGMLRGLKEEKAASLLLGKYASVYSAPSNQSPTLTYSITRSTGSPDDDLHHFTVHYQWTGEAEAASPLITANVPAGWKVTPASQHQAKGSFELLGPLDQAQNIITLSATSGSITRHQSIAVPAAWRVAVGWGKNAGWAQNTHYNSAKDPSPLDQSLPQGQCFTAPISFPVGDPSPWSIYVASNDFTGRNSPASIDFAAATFFHHGQQACGARWIYSEKERPVEVALSTQTFAGVHSLHVWLNQDRIFAGKTPKKESFPATLRKGWNQLSFRSSFIQWQWQFSIGLAGHPPDDLQDLRYSTKPPSARN